MKRGLIQNHRNAVIKIEEFLKKGNFYLAGGTAVYYYLNHRISEDLDFFTSTKFDFRGFKAVFKGSEVLECAEDTINCIIEKVKAFTYFENADIEPDLNMIKPVKWESIKEFFIREFVEV